MFRRLSSDTIRNHVHKKIYGPNAQGNEITKSLIQVCTQAKKAPIEGFMLNVKEYIQTEFP